MARIVPASGAGTAGFFYHYYIDLDLERSCKRRCDVRNLRLIEKQPRSTAEWE